MSDVNVSDAKFKRKRKKQVSNTISNSVELIYVERIKKKKAYNIDEKRHKKAI